MSFHQLFRCRDLPHWDLPGATYFVTSCLKDSIPVRGLLDLEYYTAALKAQKCPAGMTQSDWEFRRWKLVFARADHWLDRQPAARHLADSTLSHAVMDVLLHFAGERYDVYAFVVMPSHFHWIFRPRDEWVQSLEGGRSPRERIMQSVKSYSARQCNRHRDCSGAFWQEESHDHWIRDTDELERIVHYIENNPVQAGLVEAPADWPFSSARVRCDQEGIWGVPLCRLASEDNPRATPCE